MSVMCHIRLSICGQKNDPFISSVSFHPIISIHYFDEKSHPETDEHIYSLQEKYAQLEQKNEELPAKLKWYEEQFRLSQQERFGASSEKMHPEQISLFDEAEQEVDPKIPEPTVEEITYKRRKTKGKKDKMLEDLPVETVEYRLAEEEQNCPQCHDSLHEMSKEVREVRKELKVIFAQVKVVEHVRYVYACRSCEKHETTTPIITAPMPAPVLPGSFVSPSLMAFIMERKYVLAVPLYRQEQQFRHYGIELSRQTLANWMIRGATDWLSLLYERMKDHLLQHDILHADETTLQVLREDGRTATSKSYMWLYAIGHTNIPISLYDYQTTRASKHPQKMLSDFSGYLHADGYAGYNGISGVKIAGCFAHARRKFTDALKAMPEGSSRTSSVAQEGLAFCDRLFEIERKIKDDSAEQRYTQRLEHSRPLLDDYLVWLKTKKKQVLHKRAKASALIYSIVETAKSNGLSPFHYLTYLFEQLPNIDTTDPSQLDDLLPWSEALPQTCKGASTSR